DRLRQDLDRAQRISRPVDGHLDLLLEASGAATRKLLASVLGSFQFKPTGTDEHELLGALRLVRDLAATSKRWLPGFSPSAFIDQQWRELVIDSGRGRLDRHAYEVCVAYELRGALRAGRVWVPGSRRHREPASFLLPSERWRESRREFAQTVERPLAPAERLSELAGEQAELLTRLSDIRDVESEARLADGQLITDDEDPAGGTDALAKLVEQRLP